MLSKHQKFYLMIFGFLLMKICRENRRLSTEGKIVSKCCNVSKTQEGWGYHFACTSEGQTKIQTRVRGNVWLQKRLVWFIFSSINAVYSSILTMSKDSKLFSKSARRINEQLQKTSGADVLSYRKKSPPLPPPPLSVRELIAILSIKHNRCNII